MSDSPISPLSGSSPGGTQQKKQAAPSRMERAWRFPRQIRQRLRDDWHGARYGVLGLILVLISSFIVTAYYINHPSPEVYPDTPTYLAVTQHIIASGKLVDPMRLPGYPLLITLVFLVAGQGNLAAVSIVQGILFVLAVLEVYIIICMVTHRSWIGLIVGLAVASNTYLLTSIKPILSEGFSLWVVTTLALALVLFIRTLRVSYFWLVVLLFLVAFMTRPEWIYGPVLFFAFLLLVAARHGRFRRLAPHALAAVLILYGVLGLYIYENATLNGYAGVSVVERINLLGKVLQYDMQNEAPPQYATLTQEINTFKKTSGKTIGYTPNTLADRYPELSANNWALADAYASSIVDHHPIEFFLKTIPIVFNDLPNHSNESQINPRGPFGGQLLLLEDLSQRATLLYWLFPFCALMWLGLLFWRRTARSRPVEMMGALTIVCFYELLLTSVGGYESYARLHSPFNPLMLAVILGSLLLGPIVLAQRLANMPVTDTLARLWPRVRWVWGGIILGCIVVSAILTLLRRGLAALLHLHTWSGYAFVQHNAVLFYSALGLLALFTYFMYLAYRLQASGSGGQKAGSDLSPGREAAIPDGQANSLPEAAPLAQQSDS